MIANHDKTTILAGLVKSITDNTKLIKRVNDKPLSSNQFSAEEFPAIDIALGGDNTAYTVTCQQAFTTVALIRIYSNKGQDELYSIMYEIGDILNQDYTLGNTCEQAYLHSLDPPRIFNQGVSLCDISVIINYWRSY